MSSQRQADVVLRRLVGKMSAVDLGLAGPAPAHASGAQAAASIGIKAIEQTCCAVPCGVHFDKLSRIVDKADAACSPRQQLREITHGGMLRLVGTHAKLKFIASRGEQVRFAGLPL